MKPARMKNMRVKNPIGIVWIAVWFMASGCGNASAGDAESIVRDSFNYMRGNASISTVTMTIQRPDWKREVTIKAWTRGETESLFQITAPPKDEGNGTLKNGREMWTFNPKVNRVIKLPPSMMSQAWMGSDFSNDDLAKSDTLIYDYDHTLEGTETHEDKKVYLIKSMPKPGAPVVWGMLRLKIREDHVMLDQAFYDEDMKPVKTLIGSDIQIMSGRMVPKFLKMQKNDVPGEFTLVETNEVEFKESLPDEMFTLRALKTPWR
jgi:outer membrane lipoprotein-sorting protein